MRPEQWGSTGTDRLAFLEAEVERLRVVEAAHQANAKMHGDAVAYYARVERLEATLRRIASIQPRVLAMIRREGFVFETPLGESEGWEKLAFSIYSELCEIDSVARHGLAETSP